MKNKKSNEPGSELYNELANTPYLHPDKHTQGEWKQSTFQETHALVTGLNNGSVADFARIEYFRISLEEAKANARLIAAAPKMLYTLKELYENTDINEAMPDYLLVMIEHVLNIAEKYNPIANAKKSQ